jgi:catechol 2,3-dioxygenase-like lactoylglutathione lyase family enzyme
VRVLTVHHVALTVPTGRLEEARAFYSDVLGLQERERPDAELGRPGIWYQLGETELHIQCRDNAQPDSSDRHPALLVDDVEAMKEHLQSHGIGTEDAPTLLGRQRFFCRDPFGHRIEFMSPPNKGDDMTAAQLRRS